MPDFATPAGEAMSAPDTKEAAVRMVQIANGHDPEANHAEADELLCELLIQLGYVETVIAFRSMEKWYT